MQNEKTKPTEIKNEKKNQKQNISNPLQHISLKIKFVHKLYLLWWQTHPLLQNINKGKCSLTTQNIKSLTYYMHYEFRSYIFLPSGDQTLPDFSRDSQINSSLVYQRSSSKKITQTILDKLVNTVNEGKRCSTILWYSKYNVK